MHFSCIIFIFLLNVILVHWQNDQSTLDEQMHRGECKITSHVFDTSHSYSAKSILGCSLWWFSASMTMHVNTCTVALQSHLMGDWLNLVNLSHYYCLWLRGLNPGLKCFPCLFFKHYTSKDWGLWVSLGHSRLNTSRNKRGRAVFVNTGRKTGTTSDFNQLQSD